MKKLKMNVRLLRRIQKHILAEPKRYDQNATVKRGAPGSPLDEEVADGHLFPACGTVACIGGWARLLTAKCPNRLHDLNFKAAQQDLGITNKQAQRLFAYTWSKGQWPEDLRRKYADARTPEEQAAIGSERIDRFIKTKGAE